MHLQEVQRVGHCPDHSATMPHTSRISRGTQWWCEQARLVIGLQTLNTTWRCESGSPGGAVLGTQPQAVDEVGTCAAIHQDRDQNDEECARQHHFALAICINGTCYGQRSLPLLLPHRDLQPKH